MLEGLRTNAARWLLPKQFDSAFSAAVSSVQNGRTAPARGDRQLLRSYKDSPWLRAVVSKIAFHVACVPWRLFAATTAKNAGGQRFYTRHRLAQNTSQKVLRDNILKRLESADRLREIEEHPFLDLLDMSNPEMTGLASRSLIQTYLDLPGVAPVVIARADNGMPQELWPIPIDWVTRRPTDDDDSYLITTGKFQVKVPREDMLWIHHADPSSPYVNSSGIGGSLGDEIETDEFAAKFVKNVFFNRGRPDLIISTKGDVKVTEGDLKLAKYKFENQNRGVWRGDRSFWHGGALEVKQISQSLEELQVTELREFERDAFVSTYGVPPEILGIVGGSNRATIQEASVIFAREVLIPRLEFLRAEMQMKLLPMFDDRLILDYVSPMPDDRKAKLDVVKAASWAFTRREIREMAGAPDRGDGIDDIHFVQGRLLPMKPEDTESPLLLANTPESAKGFLPRATVIDVKAIGDGDIDNILEALRPIRISTPMLSVQTDEIAKWSQSRLDELGVDARFDMLNPLMVDHLAGFTADATGAFVGDRIALINGTTLKQLSNTLHEGVRAGEGIDKLAKRVGTVFKEARGPRSVVIARTEVLRSSNFGTLSSMKQSGVVDLKQWLTSFINSRETHILLHATTVKIDAVFESESGAVALHPGGFGVAAEDVQCGCQIIAVIDKPKGLEELKQVFGRLTDEILPWEKLLMDGVILGFDLQEQDIMRALDIANQI